MSSATSIKRARSVRLQRAASPAAPRVSSGPAIADPSGAGQTADDAGFRPWHFFVLASLMAATVAVLMARQSTPEHLILISLTIAAAGAAAAGFYRMLAPLAAEDVSVFSEPLTDRARAAMDREKMLVLRSIKELEFDRAMGKLSPRDFDEMAARLRARAVSIMKQLDEEGAGYRAVIERELNARLAQRGSRPAPPAAVAEAPPAAAAAVLTCPACGTTNDHDASFCKRCGGKLQ